MLSALGRGPSEDGPMTPRSQEEYAELRATIRERGTARVCLFLVGVAVWSSLTVVLLALALPPVATLIPLVALAATFEAVLALHLAVERIGRYLLVFHDDKWEHADGTLGRPIGSVGVDALFAAVFGLATITNLTPLLLTTPIAQEWVLVGAAHAAFIARVLSARAAAARQRRIDTARFEALRETD
jgi:hypothetical protein